MARFTSLIGLLTVSSLLVGCVSQEKYGALKLERDALREQLATAESSANAARAEADSYKNQLAQIMSAGGNLQALVNNLTSQNGDLTARLDDLNRKYAEAMGRFGQGQALPENLSNALTAFAQQNPDLVEFDASRGVVKFKSDVTFAVGDAQLQPKAKEVLGRFATILTSDAAASYDLMVAGHTDNQPVSNSATIAAGHKDNWYLSAHRAISVSNELQKDKVSAQRIQIAGYADQRPATSNATASGKAQNRRVEVLILPTKSNRPAVASETTTSSKKPAAAANKDTTANTDVKPSFNK